ncbi:MAG: hypothetical protein M1457_00790 [bacterium]|nr:hypothetical protein [bacterium]
MENNRKVNLGCGTLILIALIVAIFSGSSNRQVVTELNEANRKIAALDRKTDTLNAQVTNLGHEIRRLSGAIDRLNQSLVRLPSPAAGQPPRRGPRTGGAPPLRATPPAGDRPTTPAAALPAEAPPADSR